MDRKKPIKSTFPAFRHFREPVSGREEEFYLFRSLEFQAAIADGGLPYHTLPPTKYKIGPWKGRQLANFAKWNNPPTVRAMWITNILLY